MKTKQSLVKRIGTSNIIIVLMQLCMYPYLFFYFWRLPDANVVSVVFFVIILLLCLNKNKLRGSVHPTITIMMLLQSAVWFLYCLGYNDTSYLVRIFFILLAYLALLLLSKDKSIIKFSKVYNYTIFIQGILGILAFILIFINILKPFSSISFNEQGDLYEFYGLTFVKVHIGNFARINGYFDEPGAFAFWGIFALLFNKLLFDNKIMEIVLIVSLLFTFSSAYFVLLPIYLIWFYGKSFKAQMIMIVLFVPLFFLTSKYLSNNEGFSKYTIGRFEDGRIRSTRYDQADYAKSIFYSSPLFGVGAQKLEDDFGNRSSDNPYEILAKDGVFGCFFTYLPLVFIAFRFGRRKEISGAILLLALDYLQRPFHINEMHYFMLYLFCFLVLLKYERGPNESSRTSNLFITAK